MINAVAAYGHFQEGSAVAMPREKQSTQTAAQLMVANTKKQALIAAMF
jgi:hypothetical protein